MKFERELLKGVTPLVVLQTLSRGTMYGYELTTAIEQRTQNILSLGKGTLYPLLYNLEAQGLIKGAWQDTPSKRKRRYYTITGKGKKKLKAQTNQWQQLQTAVDLVFGLRQPTPA